MTMLDNLKCKLGFLKPVQEHKWVERYDKKEDWLCTNHSENRRWRQWP